MDFIKGWEGLKLVPSPDALTGLVIDVGYGHVLEPGEERRPITMAEADELLRWDLANYGESVSELIALALLQCQFDCLVSFAYNEGVHRLGTSTLLKRVNAGQFDQVPYELSRWNKAEINGVLTSDIGLTKRRAAEAAMFQDADYWGRP